METPNTNIVLVEDIDIETQPEVVVTETVAKDLEVTFTSNEYSIVGDDMVVVTKYEDAPQWLKDTISNVVDIKTAIAVGDLNQVKEALDVMLNELEVAKNTYQLSIVSSDDIDQRILTAITTLNSSLQDADATILEIANTAVTPNEASAIALNTLSASLSANGTIGSAIHNLETAMATLDGTVAESLSYLSSTMEGEISGNAEAMSTIRTYVGIDEVGASTGTGLSGYLEGTDGTFGSAGSQINNDIKITSDLIQNKWAYNSTVVMNGVSYNSGFGLATTINNNSIPVGQSEFWITADKFKISSPTNSRYQPFSIDGSNIVFNGHVSFGNNQTGTVNEAIAAVVETVSVGDKNINITDNLIPITSLVADTDNSGYQFVGTPTKSLSVGIDTYAEAQVVLDGTDEMYSPYVDEVTLSYYYRFGIKGTTSGSEFKVVTIDASGTPTYATVTITLNAGQSIVAGNWYIIEGLINPTGGDGTSANGSIRSSNGTKIGTVTNYVMPSGTAKLVLGFVANCTISRIKLCKITADTITSDLSSVNASVNVVNGLLADIASDNKLVATEKTTTKKEWDSIVSEYTKNIAQANSYAVSTTAYTTAYNALSTYITPLLADLTTTSDIVGTTFRARFKDYYDSMIDLLNAISNKINANITTTANSLIASNTSGNNDVLAQKLGYANYADMVSAANNGQTIINGGYLRTNLIQAGAITAGLIDANAISGKTISGGVITGTNIYGVNIEGSVIKASFIDLTSTATLTNWQQYTPSNYPSQYASNFAHKNDGSLLVDSLGYVRLMGNTHIVTTAVTYNSGTTYRRWDLPAYSLDYYGYDDYKNSNINRCIYPNPTLNINSSKMITYINLIGFTAFNSTNTCYASFTVHEDSYVCVATGYQGSSAGTELASGSITKNGVVIQSFSNIHGTTNIQTTTISGGIPITITVGCSLSMFGGIGYSVIVQSTNTLSTSTQVNYSGSYGTPFKLMSGYLTYGVTASVDVPAITI